MTDDYLPQEIIAYGYAVAPEHHTTVVRTWGGAEQRIAHWAGPLRKWKLPLTHMDDDERNTLIGFMEQRRGRFESFQFLDPLPPGDSFRVRFDDDANEVITRYYQGHFSDVTIVELRQRAEDGQEPEEAPVLEPPFAAPTVEPTPDPPPDPPPPEEIPAPDRIVNVSTYSQLVAALSAALPGDEIRLANGVYAGADITISQTGVILVRNLAGLQAELRFAITITGSDIRLMGLFFNGSRARVSMQGARAMLQRCVMRGCETNAVHVRSAAAVDCVIERCDIQTHPFTPGVHTNGHRRECIWIDARFTGSPSGTVVRRNMLWHTPKPILTSYHSGHNHVIALGTTASTSGIQINSVVEYNLIKPAPDVSQSDNLGGTGLVEPKSGGNIVTGNTIEGFYNGQGCWTRLGWNNTYDSNWIEGKSPTQQMQMCGFGGKSPTERNIYRGNRAINARFEIMAGTQEGDGTTSGGSWPRSEHVKLVGNNGPLRIGAFYSSWSAGSILPAQDTRVEAHTGAVELTAHQTGTTQSGTPSESFTPAVKLTPAEVGPNSA